MIYDNLAISYRRSPYLYFLHGSTAMLRSIAPSSFEVAAKFVFVALPEILLLEALWCPGIRLEIRILSSQNRVCLST